MRGWVGLDSSSLDVTHNARTKSTVEDEGRGRMRKNERRGVRGGESVNEREDERGVREREGEGG